MSANSAPNILLIMTDQQRWDYLGCYGADFVAAPNIDRLAASGVRFANAFTNAPVCAPSRIGLVTGMHPYRIGALDNNCFLPRQLPTYYQRLRDNGYRVGCVGKLDLAKPDGYNGRYGDRPHAFRWGFTHPEEVEGKMHAGLGDPEHPHGPYTHYLKDRGRLKVFCDDYRARSDAGWVIGASHDSALPVEDFADSYIGRRAAQWIDNIAADFPWHLFVSFVGPHDPFDPPTEYAERFRDAAMPAAIPASPSGKSRWVHARQKTCSEAELANIRRQYCALIKLIDDQVGLLLEALRRRDMLENTVIIFTSDHGEMLGDHGLWQKSLPYEPSIHIPLIVSGPGISGGLTSDALIDMSDINPTICALAGVDAAPDMDAISFHHILTGDGVEHRNEIMTGLRNFRCLRTATTKFIDNTNDRPELYDLSRDPAERHNIAAESPDVVADMRRRLNGYLLRHERHLV